MTTRRRYIDLPDESRRNFMKWTIGLGAALGLSPWRAFEVGESIIGPAAAGAAQSPVNRFVVVVAGNGGLAWWTQLWPFADQARPGMAFYAPGQTTAQATPNKEDHPMTLGPAAPKWGPMTTFVAGNPQIHTATPTSATTVAANVGMFAATAAIQTASPTLVPAISIGNLPYGTAPGAPALASVPNAAGMVDLFNSAASIAGGALANANDAALFEAYYKANLSLMDVAKRPTALKGITTGKIAANLLGRNLANQLRPSADDQAKYGFASFPGANANKLQNIANTLITTAKAWKLSLTSAVLLPAFNDDPHGAFGNMQLLTDTVRSLGTILQAFYDDLKATPDPTSAGLTLADSFVFAVCGDTPKNPFQPSGWPDGTPGGANWLYVRGNGLLRAGNFGDVQSGNNGTVLGWDPTTGANRAGVAPGTLAAPASAAVLYAIAKGDARRVADFYRGPSTAGVTVPRLS